MFLDLLGQRWALDLLRHEHEVLDCVLRTVQVFDHTALKIGLLTNMDTEHFYADDSEVKTREQLAEEVSKALPAAALAKRRYEIVDQGITFGIDQFLGALAPLELAEIEWPDDVGLRALPSPSWAVRDISDEPRYHGGAISHSGIPKD